MKLGNLFILVVAANLISYSLLRFFFLFSDFLAILFLADLALFLIILIELSVKNGSN